MTIASVSIKLEPKSGLHKRIVDAVRARVMASRNKFQNRHQKWKDNEERALAYLPEREIDKSRRLEREGGKPQYTTIQMPYSYAVLMAAHTYWTTVFMSRAPVLQFSGRHGETEQQIQAVEAIMDYQMQVGGIIVPLYIWMLDAGKYGLGVVGNVWEEKTSIVSSIVEEEELILGIVPTGRTKRIKKTQRIPGYQGNSLYNVRPYDFFPDPRVPVRNFQKGEFCAVYTELSWNRILEREDQGIYVNVKELQRVSPAGGTSSREGGSAQIDLPDANELGITPFKDEKAGDVFKFYECAIELVPNKWGLGKGNLPEKWVFTVTSDWKLCIGAQPQGLYHNEYPFQVLEIEPEGYGLANRGIPEILEPVQNTVDFLINAHFYNVRAVLNNQWVVDPSRIVMKDVLDPLPGNIMRLKPTAYGTDPKAAIHQLQTVDVTQNHMRDLQQVLAFGERVLGVNDQIMGRINSSGRKTATEVRSSNSFGVNRLKTTTEYFSAMGFTPLSSMMVQNTQQLYTAERKFKLVGDLAQSAGENFMEVNPEAIAGFYDFVPVDGTLPADRFAQANLWRELFGQMRNFPQLMQEYDVSRIFAWVAQLAGLKNINQFKVQVLPDQQLADEAKAGNVVPLTSGGPDSARVPAGQVSSVGPTG